MPLKPVLLDFGLPKAGQQNQTRRQPVSLRKTIESVNHLAIEQAKAADRPPRIGRQRYAANQRREHSGEQAVESAVLTAREHPPHDMKVFPPLGGSAESRADDLAGRPP